MIKNSLLTKGLLRSFELNTFSFQKTVIKKMSQGFDPSRSNPKTFVFFDLETTGLLHREGKNCRIVELSLIAVQREHLLITPFPRVLQKLSLCINPNRPIDATAISIHGLSNSLLEDVRPLSNEDYVLISTFLQKLSAPVCLVAHNGTHFDFPLLKSELYRIGKSLPDDLQCVDTLPGFRSQLNMYLEEREFLSELSKLHDYDDLLNDGNDQLLALAAEQFETLHNENLDLNCIQIASETEKQLKANSSTNEGKSSIIGGSLYWRKKANETTPMKNRQKRSYCFKLHEIYKILLGTVPISHRAENDVMNLIECVHVIGEPFVQWMDEHCYSFQNVRVYC